MIPSAVRVLVVDDHADTADSTTVVLAAHGFEARAAYSCTGALQAVEGFHPQVVVLDLRLSDGTGYSLATRLEKALGYRPAFVVMTGVGGLEGHSKGMGFGRHLVKPVPPGLLVEAVRLSVPQRDAEIHPPHPNGTPSDLPV